MTDAPNSELTTGMSSKLAPVARASGSSTIGMSWPIAVPVTTPIRRPAHPCSSSAPVSICRWSQRTLPTPFSTWSKPS